MKPRVFSHLNQTSKLHTFTQTCRKRTKCSKNSGQKTKLSAPTLLQPRSFKQNSTHKMRLRKPGKLGRKWISSNALFAEKKAILRSYSDPVITGGVRVVYKMASKTLCLRKRCSSAARATWKLRHVLGWVMSLWKNMRRWYLSLPR